MSITPTEICVHCGSPAADHEKPGPDNFDCIQASRKRAERAEAIVREMVTQDARRRSHTEEGAPVPAPLSGTMAALQHYVGQSLKRMNERISNDPSLKNLIGRVEALETIRQSFIGILTRVESLEQADSRRQDECYASGRADALEGKTDFDKAVDEAIDQLRSKGYEVRPRILRGATMTQHPAPNVTQHFNDKYAHQRAMFNFRFAPPDCTEGKPLPRPALPTAGAPDQISVNGTNYSRTPRGIFKTGACFNCENHLDATERSQGVLTCVICGRRVQVLPRPNSERTKLNA